MTRVIPTLFALPMLVTYCMQLNLSEHIELIKQFKVNLNVALPNFEKLTVQS